MDALKIIAVLLCLVPTFVRAQSISGLPAVQSLNGSEITVVVQGGVTKQAAISLVAGTATLPIIAGNTLLGNSQSTATTASAVSLTSCGGSLNALRYTLGSGFGCNTFGNVAGLTYPGNTSTFLRGDGNFASISAAAGGSSGQVQYNNSGSLGGFTVGGDGTLNTGTGALTVTKTNGTSFGPMATGAVVVSTSGNPTIATTTFMEVVRNSVAAATTVNLPASPSSNQVAVVKDGSGNAQTYNITVSGNGKNIDGASTSVIRVNYGSANFLYDGTQWNQW